jgi:hypothetical protein
MVRNKENGKMKGRKERKKKRRKVIGAMWEALNIDHAQDINLTST